MCGIISRNSENLILKVNCHWQNSPNYHFLTQNWSKTQLFRQDIEKLFFALNSPCKSVIENIKQLSYKK